MTVIRKHLLVWPFLICTAIDPTAAAYEVATHARLTQAAFARSILGDAEFEKELGNDPDAINPFGDSYYDISGGDVRERRANAFEARFMPVRADETLTLPAWLMRGAIREDDYAYAGGIWVAPNPQSDQDAPTAFWRIMNHFYDPAGNRPLTLSAVQRTVFSKATGESIDFRAAPDWAVGSQNSFASSPVPEAGRRNHYSALDAREAEYRALTGRASNGDEVAATQAERNKYWATTFRALGDAVHLIEDMAQPQHTRNDLHSGAPGFGHASIYEAYVECRATGGLLQSRANPASGAGVATKTCTPLSYDNGYTIPRFDRYSDFFSTREGSNGRGLADYSNRGFFSAGTNLGSSEAIQYPSPSNDPSAYQHEQVALKFVDSSAYGASQAPLSILKGSVPDVLLTAPTTDVPLTTEGMWYQPLADFSTPANAEASGYTLTRPNYDAMADLLIPRAVAYSAGLIDYFFRGRLATEQVSFSDDGTILTVTLKLKSAIELNDPAWNGEVLYAEDSQHRAGTLVLTAQYKLDGQDQYAASSPVPIDSDQDPAIAPGRISNQSFSFSMPSVPAVATNVQFRLVFRGRLGQEDGAVAVGRASPVSGFAFVPNYLPVDGITGSRVIEKQGGAWRLSSERGWQAGNVDWKGGYVGDMPTKVLSWAGPPSRYFPGTNPNHKFDIVIYQDGQDFAYAPYPVLGAAIAQDAAGREWLVAICTDGSNDIVYRRPNKRSDSPDLYDPVSNPDGWREIGRFSPPAGMSAPDRPWFFNGTGTEAQTMRPDNSVLNNGLTRLKMSLDAADLTVTAIAPIPNLGGDTITEYSLPSSWTINPPPTLPPCTPGAVYEYSDSAHGEITYGTTETGEYIIAVDYTASGEITATDRINGTGTATETADQNEQVTIDCGPEPGSGSITKTVVASSKGALTYTEHWQESLSFGATKVIMTTDDHTLARTQDLESTDVSGSSAQVNSQYDSVEHIITRAADFVTLDLRYGLVVVSSETFDNSYTASGPDAFAPIIGQSSLARATDIQNATRHIPVYRGTQSNSWTVPGSGNANILTRLGEVGSVVAGYQNTYDPRAKYPLPDPSIEGSWAIDAAGDLFASQGYWDINQNRSGNLFNFLSGGDLTQLVPPAPPNAFYEPIGVIH